MKLTELALCVFGGYARGIYFDIKNGKIENIYAEYSQRLLQNAICVDEKVKYENGYWICDNGEWYHDMENIKKHCIEYIRPSLFEEAKAFLPEIKSEQIKNNLLKSLENQQEFLDLFEKYITRDILNKYSEYESFNEFDEIYWLGVARDFCDKHGISYEAGDYLKYMRLRELAQRVFTKSGEVYFEVENHRIKNIYRDTLLRPNPYLPLDFRAFIYQNRQGRWKKYDGNWEDDAEAIKRRCIMYTSPHFSDIARAFIPEIKDAQIRN